MNATPNPSAAPPPPNEPTPTKWGNTPRPTDLWVKEVELAGKTFPLRRVYKQTAGRARYVFEIVVDGKDRLFSASVEGSTIGDQIARDGLPPVGFNYTIDKKESKAGSGGGAGYSLSLRQV